LAAIFSVSQLTGYLRALIDGDEVLQNVLVQGEISNCKLHSSGHLYFTLKDKASCLRAVMFRSRASGLLFRPDNGMQVIAQGNISVYERDGQYQIYVNSLQPAGLGSLHLAFQQLKQKLEAEGLFAAERKRPLPAFPKTIGIATSPTGAAIRDLYSIIRRRYPKVRVYLVPILVQGKEAPQSIVRALSILGELPEVDVVIVGRGGGSLEELWAFNDERVARAIAACAKPVISAVGHESDFTIADLVADQRAATPSAAAELVVPLLGEVEDNLVGLWRRLSMALQGLLTSRKQQLQQLSERRVLQSPERLLQPLHQRVDGLATRLQLSLALRIKSAQAELQAATGKLEALSPLAVLSRGYSVTRNRQGRVIKAALQLQPGDLIETILAQGQVISEVKTIGGSDDDRGAIPGGE
jgi:exodeoxyribonuclease VII large subunit